MRRTFYSFLGLWMALPQLDASGPRLHPLGYRDGSERAKPPNDPRSYLSTLISSRLAVTFGGRPAETKMWAPGDGFMLGADTSGFPCPSSPRQFFDLLSKDLRTLPSGPWNPGAAFTGHPSPRHPLSRSDRKQDVALPPSRGPGSHRQSSTWRASHAQIVLHRLKIVDPSNARTPFRPRQFFRRTPPHRDVGGSIPGSYELSRPPHTDSIHSLSPSH